MQRGLLLCSESWNLLGPIAIIIVIYVAMTMLLQNQDQSLKIFKLECTEKWAASHLEGKQCASPDDLLLRPSAIKCNNHPQKVANIHNTHGKLCFQEANCDFLFLEWYIKGPWAKSTENAHTWKFALSLSIVSRTSWENLMPAHKIMNIN